MASDPFETYLQRAEALFLAGDIVQAGQIWQAILKRRPGHQIARAGLYKVKLHFDARATQGGLAGQTPVQESSDARTAQGAPPKPQEPDVTRLLEQGCILYDAGHVEDALAKWAQVLAKDPDNALAKGYIDGAQRTKAQSAPAPEPVQPAAPPPEAVDTERLLRDGCTLFDMGQLEDAMRKWEQVLAHDPGHPLAWAYVQDARKGLGLPPLEGGSRPGSVREPEPAPPAPPAEEDAELVRRMIREGVQLYDMGMVLEATQKWHQALDIAPGHEDAEAYLAMAKRDIDAQAARPAPRPRPVQEVRPAHVPIALGVQGATSSRIPLAPGFEEPVPAEELLSADAVTPPSALTSQNQKVRVGLDLPELVRKISLPGWMASPVFILGLIAGLVILVFGAFYYMRYRKDKALNQTVAAFKADAVAPVARNAEIASLQQTPAEIQREAQSALGDDPLLAYLRAAELVHLNPVDPAYSQLFGQAKAELAKEAMQQASLEDFEKQLHAGDLESAERTISVLLSQNPEDKFLRARAGRLYGNMVRAYASKERWSEAETRLRRARAMLPEDGAWSVRILLLTNIQSIPRKDRASWIQLLG